MLDLIKFPKRVDFIYARMVGGFEAEVAEMVMWHEGDVQKNKKKRNVKNWSLEQY